MTEFRVQVVEIGEVRKHQNADSLSITDVHGGYPCVIRTGEFKEGDKAVYIPVDSLVPLDDPRFSFLKKDCSRTHHKIKAVKLRGVFSMGLLIPSELQWNAGEDVQEE